MSAAQTVSPVPVVGVILAAGQALRMGELGAKQLLNWRGQPLLSHVVRSAKLSQLAQVWVVVGHRAEECTLVAHNAGADLVLPNPDWQSGQASSVALAARHALLPEWRHLQGLMILLADMPFVDALLLNQLLQKFSTHAGMITAPQVDGKRGNPLVWARPLWQELTRLQGDIGARNLAQAQLAQTSFVACSALSQRDIDLPMDYQTLSLV